ncbi:MAG: phosphatidylserine decarboxylase [Bacteroidota bacterium]
MKLLAFYRFVSLNIWGNIPSQLQRSISRLYASIYNQPFTRLIIKPYSKFNYSDPNYLVQFRSASGRDYYSSFQDFFTRVYKEKPVINSSFIWPCEGLLCDYGEVGALSEINVKGDLKNIRTIFEKETQDIPDNYYFSNIFLHNNNYHRIHTPISGIIREISTVKGDLVLLRPWVYKHDPSHPAMRNERVNVTIEDEQGRNWYISIVGGPAVGTIEMHHTITTGVTVNIGDEIGKFLLGSTCCIASPEPISYNKVGDQVFLADPY